MPKFLIKISQLSFCCFSFLVLKIFTRLKIEGQENIKEVEDGPVIFASNHNSFIDSGISAAVMPKNITYLKKIAPLRFLVMDKYFSWKILPVRIFLEMMGAIKVKKAKVKLEDNSHLHEVLSEPVKFLKQGGKIWIYPEGGFHKDGTPKKIRIGVAFLRQQTEAPILPIRIIGKPIYSLGNLSLEEASNEIMRSIYGLK